MLRDARDCLFPAAKERICEMKRFLLLFLLFVLSLSLFVACRETDTTTEAPGSDSTPMESSTTSPETTLDTLGESRRDELAAMVEENSKRAGVIGDAVIDLYGLPVFGYRLAETYNPATKRASGSASVWHYTAYYAMISRLVELSEGSDQFASYTELSGKVYNGFQMYAGTDDITTYLGTASKTLYGVHRATSAGKAQVGGDKSVYDDQMWIIRENIYRYHQTKDETYLNEAIRLANICIEGWDYTLDSDGKEFGGIPWGPYYASKHTCSNAPIIAPLVEIYEIQKEKGASNADYYLGWAKKIYDYTYTNLRNNSFCYADLVGYQRVERVGSDGKKYYVTTGMAGMDAKEYTYNTGAMISGGAALYRATQETKYLTAAKQSARAAYSRFCKVIQKIPTYPIDTQTTWFNLVLLQGFIDLYPYDSDSVERYILTFQTSLDYAYEHHLKDGLLPRDYVGGWNDKSSYDQNVNVMDQAAASQMYAMLSLWAKDVLAADDAELAGIS